MRFERNFFNLNYKDKATEQVFRKNYYKETIKYIRIGITVCLLTYLSTAISDYHFFPENFLQLWLVRFGIGGIALGLPIILSYSSVFKRFPQFLQCSAAIGSTISLILAMYIGGKVGFYLFFNMIIITIILSYSVAQLFTAWAAVTSLINSLILVLSAIFLLDISVNQIIHTIIILLLIQPPGIFIAYKLEHYKRIKFEDEYKLLAEKNKLKKINITLNSRVKERTKVLNKEIILTEKSLKKIIMINKMKTKFVRILTHQLRTPLSAIRWTLESINKKNKKLSPQQKKYFMNSASESVTKAISRANDMFAAMDIGERKLTIKIETADLNSIITRAVNEVHKKNDKDFPININIPKKAPFITADPEKIENALIKILDNAIKYSKEKKEITLKVINKKNKVKIEIKDQGIGIPKKDHKMVFNSFFRGNNAEFIHTDGTGVSLALAQYYIKRHNGKIGFISEENKGSTFWVEIPKISANR